MSANESSRGDCSVVMFVRCHRRNVAATVASASLVVAALLVYHRHQLLVRDVCPNQAGSSQRLGDGSVVPIQQRLQREMYRSSPGGAAVPPRQRFAADDASRSRTGKGV